MTSSVDTFARRYGFGAIFVAAIAAISAIGLCADDATIPAAAGTADTGKVISTIPIGGHVDAAGFDADRKLAFASCGEGVLSIIKENGPDDFVALTSLPTQAGARTMALDPKTHRIYLATADYAAGDTAARPKALPDSFTIVVVGPTAP